VSQVTGAEKSELQKIFLRVGQKSLASSTTIEETGIIFGMWVTVSLAVVTFAVLFFMNLCARLSMPRNPLVFLPKEGVPLSFGSRFRQAIGLEMTLEKANAPSGVGGVTPAEALKHAFDMGLKVTPGQATQSPFWKALQAVGERSPF
jgi:hypothetical protein